MDTPPVKSPLATFWGLLWLVSCALFPAIAGGFAGSIQSEPPELVFWSVPAVILLLHATASVRISGHNLGLGILAFFCGWILMAGSFFVGCASMFSL